MSEHHRTPRKEEDDGVGKSLDEEDALEKFATRIEKIGKGVIKLGKRVGRHILNGMRKGQRRVVEGNKGKMDALIEQMTLMDARLGKMDEKIGKMNAKVVQGVVPVRDRDDVYILIKDKDAWNVDGSKDAVPPFGGSWIRHWKNKTGKNAGRCSFVSCEAEAEVGGHIWIAGGNAVYIAPICKRCNSCKNEKRMQRSGSQLRSGTEVVLDIYTNGMHRADRRIAIPERKCGNCGVDISNRPPNHYLCPDCWKNDRGGRSGRGVAIPESKKYERKCRDCRFDISNRPPNHYLCPDCWKNDRGGRSVRSFRDDFHATTKTRRE
jgi:hypothetical protein